VTEARRLVLAAVILCGWTALVVSYAGLVVLQATDAFCDRDADGFAHCPDGNGYLLPAAAMAATVSIATFLPTVLLLARRGARACRWRLAGDTALVAALPTASASLLVTLSVSWRSAWAVAGGALAVFSLAVAPVVAHRAGGSFLVVAPVVAAAGVLGGLVDEFVAVVTAPGGALLLAATYVGREGPAEAVGAGSDPGRGESQSSHQPQD
jgi:hypothetical protein